MPRCCITKRLVETVVQHESIRKLVHYYDEEIEGFMLENRGLGRGTWYFRYRGDAGKWRYYRIGSISLISLTEARTKCCTLKDSLQNGVDIHNDDHAPQQNMTLEAFVIEQYLPHARAKKRSWGLDQRILRLHILPRFGSRRMQSIRCADVSTWQGELRAKGLAPSSCNRIFVLLKTVLNCAIQWGALARENDPCQGVRPFVDVCLRERYLTPVEARRLLHALENCRMQSSARVIQLLFFTGARKSEILSAQWKHVDLQCRVLTVPLSKSGKTRHIPLSDDAVRVFNNIPRGDSLWVFPNSSGTGHVLSVFTLWNRLRKENGLPDVRLHDLRHSFASFLVNAGHSLYEVQRCLGHSDPKITMRYAHLAHFSLVKAANAVGQAVQNGRIKDS